MLTRAEVERRLGAMKDSLDANDGVLAFTDYEDPEEAFDHDLADIFAQAAQAAELAAEGAALRECLQSWAEALCKGAPWMKGEDAERIKALLADVISSPSPRAAAYQAAMRLAEHVTRPAWHTLIQVDGRAMALKEEYLSAQAACAPTGAEGTPNEH